MYRIFLVTFISYVWDQILLFQMHLFHADFYSLYGADSDIIHALSSMSITKCKKCTKPATYRGDDPVSEAKLYGVGTYKRKPYSKAGSVHTAHPNYLKQCFIVEKPNDTWVSDITYIRTKEGWVYLATVLDLYSRKIVGWATGHRQNAFNHTSS